VNIINGIGRDTAKEIYYHLCTELSGYGASGNVISELEKLYHMTEKPPMSAEVEKEIAPFVDAFEKCKAEYEDLTPHMRDIHDMNQITPSMTMGDFRRLYEAVVALKEEV
jgi:hypothetical protein